MRVEQGQKVTLGTEIDFSKNEELVEEYQEEFVASNIVSIAQAYTAIGTACSAFPFGIYDGEKAVGFLMIGFGTDD